MKAGTVYRADEGIWWEVCESCTLSDPNLAAQVREWVTPSRQTCSECGIPFTEGDDMELPWLDLGGKG